MSVAMLRWLLWAYQAVGSAALIALDVSAVLEALALRYGFGSSSHTYGTDVARELRTHATMARQSGMISDPKIHENHLRCRGEASQLWVPGLQ